MTESVPAIVFNDNRIEQQAAAVEAAFRAERAVAVHKDFDLTDIESLLPRRVRYRSNFQTSDFDAFVVHVQLDAAKAECEPSVFVRPDTGKASAFFNLGDPNAAGHGDWTAGLTLSGLPEFSEYNRLNQRRLGQREFAEWLDDWSHCLKCFDASGSPMELAKVVAAVRRVEIEGTSERSSSVGDYTAEKSAMEKVAAKNQDSLPARVVLAGAPYPGFDDREFTLRVSLVTGDSPQFSLRAIADEQLKRMIGDEFVDKLQVALPALSVRIGELSA